MPASARALTLALLLPAVAWALPNASAACVSGPPEPPYTEYGQLYEACALELHALASARLGPRDLASVEAAAARGVSAHAGADLLDAWSSTASASASATCRTNATGASCGAQAEGGALGLVQEDYGSNVQGSCTSLPVGAPCRADVTSVPVVSWVAVEIDDTPGCFSVQTGSGGVGTVC